MKTTPIRTDKKALTICVFSGASMGADPAYAKAARRMGTLIGKGGYNFLFGAGSLGLMGESARGARDAGAQVHGILPEFLRYIEPPMTNGETQMTPDLYVRKERMISLSDAFIILPGGLGTLDEFFEVITSAQLGVHTKPIVAVNTNNFFTPLKALVDHVVAEGFARPENAGLYHMANTPDDAMSFITQALAQRV